MSYPESQHTHAHARSASMFDEESAGLSMAPPAFQLMASPIQRRVDPDLPEGTTDYRFDTAQITAADLSNPATIERFRRMNVDGLLAYLERVHDPEVASYLQTLITERTQAPTVAAAPPTPPAPPAPTVAPAPPAASTITDTRTRVLPDQMAMYNDLSTYMQGLPARMTAILASPPANFSYLQNNPNATQVVTLTQQLANDLARQAHIVRFDASLIGTSLAASYGFTTGLIKLRPFNNARERSDVVSSLLHEYTHYQQDQVIEQAVLATRNTHVHSVQEEVDHEVGGRRSGVYMSMILQALGEGSNDFNSLVSDAVFRGRFERERTGTAAESRAATADIRSQISSNYSAQISHNAPSATYFSELDASNHIQLRVGAASRDLGAVPATVTRPEHLAAYIEGQIRSQPNNLGIFENRVGRRVQQYGIITVLTFHQDRKLCEFAMQP